MSELKPCPWCANSKGLYAYAHGKPQIRCSRCGAMGPDMAGTFQGAEEMWNQGPGSRTSPLTPAERRVVEAAMRYNEYRLRVDAWVEDAGPERSEFRMATAELASLRSPPDPRREAVLEFVERVKANLDINPPIICVSTMTRILDEEAAK